MNVQAEARPRAVPERVYPLATVLNPRTNRSIHREELLAAAIGFAVLALAALLLLF